MGVETTLERGYHESLTRLWLYECDAYIEESGLGGLEAVRALVAAYGRRSDLHKEYYSYEVVRDPDARYGWQPPDLRPLPAAWRRGGLLVSTNPRLLHIPTIHGFLSESYWAKGISRRLVERSIRGSLCFGVYENGLQAGFARVITDRATFAYIGDVFVLPEWRGRGLSRWLMDCLTAHPSLQGLRRWHLVTRDAHGLYKRYGFRTPEEAHRHMELLA
jgi:GNAT superfamily N-acetyltransferase